MNKINVIKQYEQLLAAYAMLEAEYQRYKKGVKEALGEEGRKS